MERSNIISDSVIPTWWRWRCTWHLLLQFQGICWLDQTNFQTVWLDPKKQADSPQSTEKSTHRVFALISDTSKPTKKKNTVGTSNISSNLSRIQTRRQVCNRVCLCLYTLTSEITVGKCNSRPRLLCISSSCYSGPWLYGHSLISCISSLQMRSKSNQDLYQVDRRV